ETRPPRGLPPGDTSRTSRALSGKPRCVLIDSRQRRALLIWLRCQGTAWKRLRAIAPDSSRFASTINGGFGSSCPADRLDRWTSRSSIITKEGTAMPRTPIHPGEHLAEELRELGITAAELSRQIDVPVNRITGIIHGQRGITADTALRLAHWFGTTPQFWMNLQQLYELRLAENDVGTKIAALPRRPRRMTLRKLGKMW